MADKVLFNIQVLKIAFIEIGDDLCEGKQCGDTCVVEGDMAGQCNATLDCSFDYDNLGCDGNTLFFCFNI